MLKTQQKQVRNNKRQNSWFDCLRMFYCPYCIKWFGRGHDC